jgi:hypothetical protein
MKDTEYESWSEDVRYLYDERLSILTDGFRAQPTSTEESIARAQARAANDLECPF